MWGLVFGALLLVSSLAVADPARSNDAGASIAAGVNLPLGWANAESIAGSIHVGFHRHHAIRGTFASNPFSHNLGRTLIDIAINFDAEGSKMSGRVTEVGVGYQYFPRSFLRGPVLEAGVFRRHIDGVEDYRLDAPEYIATDTVGYGARGLIGWSWRFWRDHVFVATAFGLGMARHTGTETTSMSTLERDDRTESVTRYEPSAEFYIRIGGAFDF